jgi:hypothetical protein
MLVYPTLNNQGGTKLSTISHNIHMDHYRPNSKLGRVWQPPRFGCPKPPYFRACAWKRDTVPRLKKQKKKKVGDRGHSQRVHPTGSRRPGASSKFSRACGRRVQRRENLIQLGAAGGPALASRHRQGNLGAIIQAPPRWKFCILVAF